MQEDHHARTPQRNISLKIQFWLSVVMAELPPVPTQVQLHAQISSTTAAINFICFLDHASAVKHTAVHFLNVISQSSFSSVKTVKH